MSLATVRYRSINERERAGGGVGQGVSNTYCKENLSNSLKHTETKELVARPRSHTKIA